MVFLRAFRAIVFGAKLIPAYFDFDSVLAKRVPAFYGPHCLPTYLYRVWGLSNVSRTTGDGGPQQAAVFIRDALWQKRSAARSSPPRSTSQATASTAMLPAGNWNAAVVMQQKPL